MAAVAAANLYYTEGSSDKVYQAEIVEVEGGNVVNFRYGRRGSALTSGTKTSEPVDIASARKIFDRLVKEKTSKGYTPDASGTAYQGTEHAGTKTDFVPQLLNPISEEDAMRLIEDPAWVAQEKKDGERRAAHADNAGSVVGMNRKGLAVPLPQCVATDLERIARLSGAIRIDGEQIGEVLHVFDIHVKNGTSRRDWPFVDRAVLADVALQDCTSIKFVPVATTTEEKRALWNQVKAAKGEGIVFKKRDSQVKEGRPASGGDWVKFKFTEHATCIVTSINSGKRSVAIGLYNDAIGGEIVPVGNVTIPPNYEIPSVDVFVEVEYLYAYKNGSLYQPVYRGERTDLDKDACILGQLKFKPEGGDEE